jgi:peptide/nickel transport system substrate-binding protein
MSCRVGHVRRGLVAVIVAGLVAGVMVVPAPAVPAGGTVTIAIFTDPVTMDPHRSNDGPSITIWNQIYNTLVDHNARGEIVPMLAERWQRIGDRSWRFYLRKGVKFHDGTELTAEDVKFSLERLINPATRSPAAFLLNVLDRVEVEGTHQVRLVMKNPFAPLLNHLVSRPTSIVPAARVRASPDEFARRPIGTGPFRFVSFVRGDRVELVRNPDYFKGATKIERLVVRVIPEASTAVAELESGGVQALTSVPAQDVGRLRRNRNLTVAVIPSHRITALVINTERAPFNDVRVRQALSYAIDRKGVLDAAESGLGVVASGPLSPIIFGHNDKLQPYPKDLNKARQLLAEAGVTNLRTEILVWNLPAIVRMAEPVQAQLREAGIDASLRVMEFGAALQQQYAGNFALSTMQWGTVTLDGDYSMYALFHSDSIGPPGNWARYRRPQVDQLIATGRANGNPEVRRRAYFQAQEIIAADAPWIFLYHPSAAYAVRAELKGVVIPPAGPTFINVTEASLGQ